MTRQELAAGVARNNARALDPARWKLRWIFQQIIPTGTFIPLYFEVPASAAVYRLEYVMLFWPVTGAFRPLFLEVADDKGIKYTYLNPKRVETSNGVNAALFTTPTTDPDSALAGDQAQYLGMLPLNLEFPGRSLISVNIRGALGTPNPATIDLLLTGHYKGRA